MDKTSIELYDDLYRMHVREMRRAVGQMILTGDKAGKSRADIIIEVVQETKAAITELQGEVKPYEHIRRAVGE